MAELVTFGESMLRLTPQENEPIGLTEGFDVRAGGAESNVAAAAQSLGVDATWMSKLPNSSIGHRVENELREYGISTEVVWSDEGRQGLYFLENGGMPRGMNVVYDRANAAITTSTFSELRTSLIEDAEVFHTTGITPALSSTLENTVKESLSVAQKAETTTSFDLNYRTKLWTPEEAQGTFDEILPTVDILTIAHRDAQDVMGLSGEPIEIANKLQDKYGNEIVIITQGEQGTFALHKENIYEQEIYEADTIDPIGTGDANVGGFLAQRIQGESVKTALQYGAAMAAIKRTLPGDMIQLPNEDIEKVLKENSAEIDR